MTASTEVLIGDPDGQHVLVRLVCRNQPGLFENRGGNRVVCDVQISAGGFRAAFTADMRSEDFQTFLDEAEALSRALDGTATLSSPDEQIAVTLTGDGVGQVRVEGDVLDVPGSHNRLAFGFDIDRANMPQICRSLEVVLAAFPVLGT